MTEGVYSVQATVDHCSSALSDPLSLIITGIAPAAESAIKLYPNPASSRLIIELPAENGPHLLQLLRADGSGTIKTLETIRQTVEWDVRDLAAGAYIVRVKYFGKTEHHKFIKR